MYNFVKPALITEKFLLPSNGKLYRENGSSFDGNLTLRAMTTIEERMRLSSDDFYESMIPVVNECIVDNKKPDGSYGTTLAFPNLVSAEHYTGKAKYIMNKKNIN